MTTDTQFSLGKDADPRAIYDALMTMINPELTTSNIDGLKEKYADESEEARAQRRKKYEEDYKAFEDLAGGLFGMVGDLGRTFKKTAMASAEEKSRAEERKALDQLEAHFDSP